VALTGVYLNRSGEPESRLVLSQRELSVPWDWRGSKENSGLALGLNWRVGTAESSGDYYGGYSFSGGTPDWLDEARMAALGFDTTGWALDKWHAPPLRALAAARRAAGAGTGRPVLAAGAGAGAGERRAPRGGAAGQRRQQGIRRQGQARAEQLEREEVLGSRLFAIDAGLDRAALRAKYPDRSRFLILKAHVRPRLDSRERKTWVTGYVSELAVPTVNVPHALRPGLEPVLRDTVRTPVGTGRRFEATLAVGRRLEPWIEAVAVPATPSR
jgi:hypothetical protein